MNMRRWRRVLWWPVVAVLWLVTAVLEALDPFDDHDVG